MVRRLLLISLFCVGMLAQPSLGQAKEQKLEEGFKPSAEEIAYLEDLERIARVLGAAHRIRLLCKSQSDQVWRNQMRSMVELEAPGDDWKREALIEAFNIGFRSQEGRYEGCTDAARRMEKQLAREGKTLAELMISRNAR